jgi:hypothetical protein
MKQLAIAVVLAAGALTLSMTGTASAEQRKIYTGATHCPSHMHRLCTIQRDNRTYYCTCQPRR